MLKSSFFQAVALAPQAQRIASPERFVAMPSSDEALVTRSLRGDAQAFAELVTRYTAPIFNLVLRLTNDHAEAENMTQETFLRAYAALPRSRTDLAFKP